MLFLFTGSVLFSHFFIDARGSLQMVFLPSRTFTCSLYTGFSHADSSIASVLNAGHHFLGVGLLSTKWPTTNCGHKHSHLFLSYHVSPCSPHGLCWSMACIYFLTQHLFFVLLPSHLDHLFCLLTSLSPELGIRASPLGAAWKIPMEVNLHW